MVSANEYLINDGERNKLPLSPEVEWGWSYQFYFATERGRVGYAQNRRDLVRLVWEGNSLSDFGDATFDRTLASIARTLLDDNEFVREALALERGELQRHWVLVEVEHNWELPEVRRSRAAAAGAVGAAIVEEKSAGGAD